MMNKNKRPKSSLVIVVLFSFLASPTYCGSNSNNNNNNKGQNNVDQIKSRQKRVLWVTEDGRLALPPGTTMIISPSLSMPFVRHPPEGFFSNLTISLPFTIDFDKLGLTDNENPYGELPPLLARSMGRAAGGILTNYIEKILQNRRGKRSINDNMNDKNSVQSSSSSAAAELLLHGGERVLLYLALEELLENFGLDGKACLLRAICEVHAHSLKNYGFVGEILRLFLTASRSPFSELIREYVQAENAGKGLDGGASECWPYMKQCSKSIFLNKHNKYNNYDNNEEEENEIM